MLKIKTLSEYEEEQKNHLQFGGGNLDEKRYRAEQISKLFRVLYFFEKTAFMLEAGMLDETVTQRLLREPARAYGTGLVRPLLANERQRGHLAGLNWIALLERIDRVILQRWQV